MATTPNAMLRITDEKTLQLIELYETEECLWNTNAENYKNRSKRREAAKRIAQKLDIKNFDARCVTIKFKNLRNSYCQELKKIALNALKGEENEYRPRVFWFNKMDSFLRPHLHQKTHQDLMTLSNAVVKNDSEAEEWVQMTNPEDVLLHETVDVKDHYSGSDHEDYSMDSPARKRPRSATHSKNENTVEDNKDTALVATLRDICSQLHVMTNQQEDCFDSFGKYIASMLRDMPKQKALEVQPKIVSLVTTVGISTNEEQISQSSNDCNDS